MFIEFFIMFWATAVMGVWLGAIITLLVMRHVDGMVERMERNKKAWAKARE